MIYRLKTGNCVQVYIFKKLTVKSRLSYCTACQLTSCRSTPGCCRWLRCPTSQTCQCSCGRRLSSRHTGIHSLFWYQIKNTQENKLHTYQHLETTNGKFWGKNNKTKQKQLL